MRVVAVEWLKGSRSAPDGIETCTAYKAVGSLNESGCMAISREEKSLVSVEYLHLSIRQKGGLTLAAPFICSAAVRVRGEANTRRPASPRGYVLWTTVQLLVLV